MARLLLALVAAVCEALRFSIARLAQPPHTGSVRKAGPAATGRQHYEGDDLRKGSPLNSAPPDLHAEIAALERELPVIDSQVIPETLRAGLRDRLRKLKIRAAEGR